MLTPNYFYFRFMPWSPKIWSLYISSAVCKLVMLSPAVNMNRRWYFLGIGMEYNAQLHI